MDRRCAGARHLFRGCPPRPSSSVSCGATGPRDLGGGGPAHIPLRRRRDCTGWGEGGMRHAVAAGAAERRGEERAAAWIFVSRFLSPSCSPPSPHPRHGFDPPQPPGLCRRRRRRLRRQRCRVVAAAGSLARGCHGRRGVNGATAAAAAVDAADVLAAAPAGGATAPPARVHNVCPTIEPGRRWSCPNTPPLCAHGLGHDAHRHSFSPRARGAATPPGSGWSPAHLTRSDTVDTSMKRHAVPLPPVPLRTYRPADDPPVGSSAAPLGRRAETLVDSTP